MVNYIKGKFNLWCFLFGHSWTTTPHGNLACPRCGEVHFKEEYDEYGG